MITKTQSRKATRLRYARIKYFKGNGNAFPWGDEYQRLLIPLGWDPEVDPLDIRLPPDNPIRVCSTLSGCYTLKKGLLQGMVFDPWSGLLHDASKYASWHTFRKEFRQKPRTPSQRLKSLRDRLIKAGDVYPTSAETA